MANLKLQPTTTKPKAIRKSAGVANDEALTQDGNAERLAWIAKTAYFKAEARGFAPGKDLDDWLAAEAEFGARAVH
jgi:hypothetical protein